MIVEYYNDYYRNGKFLIFVAEKLHANIFPLLDRHFGDSNNKEVEVSDYPFENALQKKYRVTNDPDGVQGAIRMSAHFPNRHHPDFLKPQVLNNVYGGF